MDNTHNQIPGREGTIGPGPSQYGQPHVYARDIHSGAGNCVCGHALGAWRHTEAAPGIPIPAHHRSSTSPQRVGLDAVRAAVKAARGGYAPPQVTGWA